MNTTYDIIVLGVGAMGASTCYHLARRGIKVVGLEQFDIPHSRGSSYGYSRMIRLAYYEHPHYVPLLRRAYELWREIESAASTKILHVTGGLYMGKPDAELIEGSLRAAAEHNLAHERLSHADLASRFPQFALPGDFVGMWEPAAGYLRPEKSISVMANLAMRNGAELHGHEPVVQWTDTASGVEVRTARATYHAKQLVVCGGAWSAQLLDGLKVDLKVTRQVLGWVWPRSPQLFQEPGFPVWAIGYADGSLHYGFPMLTDNPGLKIAHHAPGASFDPNSVDRSPNAGDEQTFLPALEKFLPDGVGPTLAMRICLYTNTRDGHFIIDRHPVHQHVTLACGFSGHGFKFASVIGEILADLAAEGKTELPIDFLRLSRFR